MSSTPDLDPIFAVLAKPFFKKGVERVFGATCCGKVYVGPTPAGKCKTCSKPADNRTLEKAVFCP
jgi:hypothetical protein